MSDFQEATGALTQARDLIDEAVNEKDHSKRLGDLLMIKEVVNQGVKFQRRAFLAASGFGQGDQGALPLDGD